MPDSSSAPRIGVTEEGDTDYEPGDPRFEYGVLYGWLTHLHFELVTLLLDEIGEAGSDDPLLDRRADRPAPAKCPVTHPIAAPGEDSGRETPDAATRRSPSGAVVNTARRGLPWGRYAVADFGGRRTA